MKMRKLIVMIIIILQVQLVNCVVENNISGPGFNYDDPKSGEKINGSGYLITRNLDLSDFDSIEFNIPGTLYIEPGNGDNVEITVDDNIYGYLNIEVTGNKLSVSRQSGVDLGEFDLTIRTEMSDLRKLQTNSIGRIEGKGKFVTDYLWLETNSIGSISLDIEAQEIQTTVSSIGSVVLSGLADKHFVSLNSIGSLDAFELVTKTTKVQINSLGNAEIYAKDRIEASVTSMGSLYYKGEPEVIILQLTSLGRIIKVY